MIILIFASRYTVGYTKLLNPNLDLDPEHRTNIHRPPWSRFSGSTIETVFFDAATPAHNILKQSPNTAKKQSRNFNNNRKQVGLLETDVRRVGGGFRLLDLI